MSRPWPDIHVLPTRGNPWVLAIDAGSVVRMSPGDPRVRIGRAIRNEVIIIRSDPGEGIAIPTVGGSMSLEARVPPQLLREAGLLLYGSNWRAELAQRLRIKPASLAAWANGRQDIPARVGTEIAAIMEERMRELAWAAAKLKEGAR